MTIEEAIGLVNDVRNCSLPWDDEHWTALCIIVDYVENKIKYEHGK